MAALIYIAKQRGTKLHLECILSIIQLMIVCLSADKVSSFTNDALIQLRSSSALNVYALFSIGLFSYRCLRMQCFITLSLSWRSSGAADIPAQLPPPCTGGLSPDGTCAYAADTQHKTQSSNRILESGRCDDICNHRAHRDHVIQIKLTTFSSCAAASCFFRRASLNYNNT